MNRTSHSRLSRWEFCPAMDKLYSIDLIKLKKQNEHFAFGKSIHHTLDKIFKNEAKSLKNLKKIFQENFVLELSSLPEEDKDFLFKKRKFSKEEDRQFLIKNRISLTDMIEKRTNIIKEMAEKGPYLSREAFRSLEKKFPDYSFISSEFPFEFQFASDWTFEGILDILIQQNNKKFGLIDWKSSAAGWTEEQKIEDKRRKQLSLYKHFFCKQQGIPETEMEVFFAICKRNAIKIENGKISISEDPIEFLEVKDDELQEKSLKILDQQVYNVEHKNFVKNRSNCKWCLYHNVHCFPDPFIKEKK